MNPQANLEMIKLVVSWALIGAFLFTAILTLLSLAGLPGFSDSEQRNKLFYTLVAEIVIAGIAFFAGAFQPAPGAVVKAIEQPLTQASAKLEQDNQALLAGQTHLNGELDETKRQLAESVKKASAYGEQIAQANANAEAQRETIAHLQNSAKPASPQPAIVNSDETDALKQRAEKAEAELAESKQIEETLNRKLKDYESKISALSESKREKDRQVQRGKVTGRVLATNPGWNFVVLSIGDKQGVIPDSTLLVLRGGAQIAKLRVKTIEASQSIADVIPSTVRKGITVQPGDNVVFEESRNPPPVLLAPPSRTQRSVQIEPDLPPLPVLNR
jgi:hypothetical protein